MNKKTKHGKITAEYAMERAVINVEEMIELAFEQGEAVAPHLERIFEKLIQTSRENPLAKEDTITELENRFARILESFRELDTERKL